MSMVAANLCSVTRAQTGAVDFGDHVEQLVLAGLKAHSAHDTAEILGVDDT